MHLGMDPWRRRVWIGVVASLRKASAAPWVAFAIWCVFATMQEPTVLRASGVLIREPAVWAGATTLWLIFALQNIRRESRAFDRFAALLFLQVLVALAATCLLLVAGWLRNEGDDWGRCCIGAGVHLAALAPVGLALALRSDRDRGLQVIIKHSLTVFSLGPATAILAAAPLAAGSSLLFAGSGLSISACLLLMIAGGAMEQPRPVDRRTT